MTINPYHRSLQHDIYVRTVIRTIAAQEQARTRQPIPEDVLMVGDDWIYLAKVNVIGESSMFTINPVHKFGFPSKRPLADIIEDFYSQTLKLSLIPEGDQRIQEARDLGEVLDEREFSFRVRRNNRELSVYLIRDARHVVNDNNTLPKGDTIEWTYFPKK